MVKVLLCVFLSLFFLTACGQAPADSSALPESSISPESSSGESPESGPEQTKPSESSRTEEPPTPEAQESSETGESETLSYPVVDWEHFTKLGYPLELEFPQDDPSQDMSYEEYFSTERYLNSYELQTTGEYGAVEDMRGYLYVKGETNNPPCWNWEVPEDNLYLFCKETGERVLLAEIKNLRYIRVFIDRLYLITETEVWRCGRLGENLTLVYEHPENIYIFAYNSRSADVLFFLTFEESQCLWRLYLPGGRAEKACDLSDLPQSPDGISIQLVSNFAVLVAGELEDGPWQWYIYSVRTGTLTLFEYNGVANTSACFDAWVRKYYPLNRY